MLFLVALAAGIVLAVSNPDEIGIDLYFAQFRQTVGVALLLALLLGIGLCLLFYGGALLRYRHKLSRLQKQYNLAHEELQNLRRMMVRDQEQ